MNKNIYITIFTILCVPKGFGEEISSQNRTLLKILNANSNWNIIEKTDDSIYISEKLIKGSELNAVKVEKEYNIKPELFTDVIMNVGGYDSFLSNAKSLRSKVINDTPSGLIGYQRIKVNLPFFNDREYYFYMSRKPFDVQSANVMCYWILLDPEQSPEIFNQSENSTYLREGAGLWKWEPSQSGGVKISYTLTMHPGGSIPDFILEMINKNSIVGLLRDVENEVYSNNGFSD